MRPYPLLPFRSLFIVFISICRYELAAEPIATISGAAVEAASVPTAGVHHDERPQCFNCGSEDHNLANCPAPVNANRVRAARREWQNRRGTAAADARYWDAATVPSADTWTRYAPGQLTERLRAALGMQHPQELPPYYWRMHVAGYPPGYFQPLTSQTAPKEDDGLAIFDTETDYEQAQASERSRDQQHCSVPAAGIPTQHPPHEVRVPQVFYPGLVVTPRACVGNA